jgi:hypothetical protein
MAYTIKVFMVVYSDAVVLTVSNFDISQVFVG